MRHMRLIVKQYQTEWLEWFVPSNRRRITERDRARVAVVVADSVEIETGYYDLVLTDGRNEYDATIEIK